MADVSRAIQHYIDDHIRLSRPDIARSIRTRDWLIGRIITKIEEKTNEPVLYAPKRFLNFGSYFKGTKVQNVDEFDILIILDTNSGYFFENGIRTAVGQGSAYPNHLFDYQYQNAFDANVSPIKILNWLKGIVTEILEPQGSELPVRNQQAVVAYLSGTNTTIDLVPAAILQRFTDDKLFYAIPQGGQSSGWLATAPEDDMQAVETAAENRTNFKNAVRICKRIKETHRFSQVSSFAIETIMVSYVWHNDWYQNLFIDCNGALRFLAATFRQGSISDPFSGKNILQGASGLDTYASRIDSIMSTLSSCVNIDDQSRVNNLVSDAFENE